jgi:hypothetical protein
MRSAIADLGLERITVLYPGSQEYELDRRVRVVPLTALAGGGSVLVGRSRLGRSAERLRACRAPLQRYARA